MNIFTLISRAILSIDKRVWLILFSRMAIHSYQVYKSRQSYAAKDHAAYDLDSKNKITTPPNPRGTPSAPSLPRNHNGNTFTYGPNGKTLTYGPGFNECINVKDMQNPHFVSPIPPIKDSIFCDICFGNGDRCWKCGGTGWSEDETTHTHRFLTKKPDRNSGK